MLEKHVDPLLPGLALLGQVAVVPHVLGLEVLVDGQVDGVVGRGHALLGRRGPAAAPQFSLGLAARLLRLFHVDALEAHGGLGGEAEERVLGQANGGGGVSFQPA